MARFRCLYTRDERKKRRVYHDGVIHHRAPGAPPVLTNEAGAVLATAERGVAALDPHADGLELFLGFLVDMDGVEGEEEAAPTTHTHPPPRPGLVGAATGGSVPRVLRPSRLGAVGRRAAAFMAPPVVAARPLTEDGAAASSAPPSAARSDDEILGLLAARPPRQAAAPSEPAGAWRPPRADTTARQPLAPARQPAAPSTRWTDRCKRSADDGDDDDGRRGAGDATPQLSTSLRFPDAAAAAAPPVRTVALPTTFPNTGAYTTLLADAVVDELQIRLHLCARAFRGAVASLPPRSPPPTVERAARRAGAEFYGSADLQATAGPSRAHADRGPPPGGGALFLTLHSGRLASSAYRQGDLWVIASDAALAGLAPGAVGDRTAGPWVTVARALWHGPNSEGRLAVALLTPRPPALRRAQPVCALRVGDAGTDLACLTALRGGGAGRLPALPALLGAPLPGAPPATGRAAADAAAHAAAAHLNDDQAAVIDRLAAWVAAPAPRPPTTVLVHGPFGCGKSALLVAATAFLARKPREVDDGLATTTLPPGCGLRVFVVSHTNAAVDRVLVGLLDAGFDDVLRVGPVRKIHARLLSYSLSSPTAKAADVVADLTAMVRDAPSRAAAAAAAAELERVKAGALTRRRAALARASVVGATAVSAGGLPPDTPPFDVAVVDEASQLTEPLVLLALAAARPACVIVAGDPKQLPPVVSGPAAPAPRPGAPRPAGLARSLLSRLIDAGNDTLLLRTQYRCHPEIAALANAAFYGGALRDGVSADARPPLLPGLPPVAFVPVPGGVSHAGGGRSPSNEAEARAVVRCARALRGAGITAGRVGVICFYRAQAALVGRLLAQGEQGGEDGAGTSTTAVATVDSFQGSEKDVIILSTVVARASPFAGDAARLCVALTRGRHHLVVVGHPGALTEDAVLGQVVGGAGVWRP